MASFRSTPNNKDLDNLKRLAQSMQAQKKDKVYGPSDYGGYTDINRTARRKNSVKKKPQKPSKIIQALAGTDGLTWTDGTGNVFQIYSDEAMKLNRANWEGMANIANITLNPRPSQVNIIETKGD